MCQRDRSTTSHGQGCRWFMFGFGIFAAQRRQPTSRDSADRFRGRLGIPSRAVRTDRERRGTCGRERVERRYRSGVRTSRSAAVKALGLAHAVLKKLTESQLR